jgi:hypothetical protein
MPYLLLYRTVPFIGLTRSLSRYDLMVMLALGVLVALALGRLTLTCEQLIKTGRWRPGRQGPEPVRYRATGRAFSYVVPLVAGLLICFEFLPVPYPVSPIDTPAFYYQLADDPEDYTIAELPMNWDRPTPLLHQTTHGKRLLTAYTSRDNPLELARRTPVLQQWRYLGPDIIDLPLELVAPTISYDFNLRYVVLDYWQMPSPEEQAANERWVFAALPETTPIYDDGRLKVYPTPPRQNIVTYLTLGNSWSDRQEDETGPVSRTFVASRDGRPELFLHHPEERALFLEITAASETPQNLTLLVNDEPAGTVALTDRLTEHSVRLPWLAGQIVRLDFISDNPGETIRVTRISLDGIQGCSDPGAHF